MYDLPSFLNTGVCTVDGDDDGNGEIKIGTVGSEREYVLGGICSWRVDVLGRGVFWCQLGGWLKGKGLRSQEGSSSF